MVVARGAEEREMEDSWVKGTEFQLGSIKTFWRKMVMTVAQ